MLSFIAHSQTLSIPFPLMNENFKMFFILVNSLFYSFSFSFVYYYMFVVKARIMEAFYLAVRRTRHFPFFSSNSLIRRRKEGVNDIYIYKMGEKKDFLLAQAIEGSLYNKYIFVSF